MSDFLEEIEHIVDATIPDKDELIHEGHRDRDYAMLITRNLLVGVAAVLFILFTLRVLRISAVQVPMSSSAFC